METHKDDDDQRGRDDVVTLRERRTKERSEIRRSSNHTVFKFILFRYGLEGIYDLVRQLDSWEKLILKSQSSILLRFNPKCFLKF